MANITRNNDAPDQRAKTASLVGSVVAAILASSCCLGPAILALLGASGIGFAAKLAPYRPYFLGVTALLLGSGFYLSYRRPRRAAAGATAAGATGADACGCERPRAARSGRRMLWIASFFVAIFASYPYIASAFAHRTSAGPAVAAGATQTLTFHVDGMDCAACATAINKRLARLPGIARSSVDYSAKSVDVTFDPKAVTPQAIIQAIDELGYGASLPGAK